MYILFAVPRGSRFLIHHEPDRPRTRPHLRQARAVARDRLGAVLPERLPGHRHRHRAGQGGRGQDDPLQPLRLQGGSDRRRHGKERRRDPRDGRWRDRGRGKKPGTPSARRLRLAGRLVRIEGFHRLRIHQGRR